MLGLPTIKFRPATVADLDDDNVVIFNRASLEQERFTQDHMKGIGIMQEAIKQIERKLAETKQKLIADEGELEQLREQRGRLFVEDSKKHANQITKLDNTIEQLQNFVTNTPAVIDVLEKQLAEAKTKFAAEARDELLNKQKEITKQTKELSKRLVATLESAVKTNRQLQTVYTQYKQLHDLTKADLLGSKFAEPSGGMLEYLYSFLRGELEDGKHVRLETPGELPPL